MLFQGMNWKLNVKSVNVFVFFVSSAILIAAGSKGPTMVWHEIHASFQTVFVAFKYP